MKFLLILTLGLAGCARTSPRSQGDPSNDEREQEWPFVPVAAISGIDVIAEVHVTNLLKANGIESEIEGSVVYGVAVPKENANRAVDILMADVLERPYWIRIGRGLYKDMVTQPFQVRWVERQIDDWYGNVLASGECADATELEAVLRHEEVRRAAQNYGYVLWIRTWERKYMNSEGILTVGYDVELELRRDQDRGIWRHRFQVMDGGAQVMTMGGSSFD